MVEGQGVGDSFRKMKWWVELMNRREGLKHEWTNWIYGKGDRNLSNGWENFSWKLKEGCGGSVRGTTIGAWMWYKSFILYIFHQ